MKTGSQSESAAIVTATTHQVLTRCTDLGSCYIVGLKLRQYFRFAHEKYPLVSQKCFKQCGLIIQCTEYNIRWSIVCSVLTVSVSGFVSYNSFLGLEECGKLITLGHNGKKLGVAIAKIVASVFYPSYVLALRSTVKC